MTDTQESLVKEYEDSIASLMKDYGWFLKTIDPLTLIARIKEVELSEHEEEIVKAVIAKRSNEQVKDDFFNPEKEQNLIEKFEKMLGISELCKELGKPIFVYRNLYSTLILIDRDIYKKCEADTVSRLYKNGVKFKLY